MINQNQDFKIYLDEILGDVRTLIDSDGKVWFVGKDICNILEIRNSRDAISVLDKDEKELCYILVNGKTSLNKTVNMICEKGLMHLITKSKKTSSNKREDLLLFLQSNNLISKNTVYIPESNESLFNEKLKNILKTMRLTTIFQYPIDKYRVDFYIKEINTVIEYDEDCHKSYSLKKEQKRQSYIENKLKCKFIRVNNSFTDEEDIGIIIFKIADDYVNFKKTTRGENL